MQTDSFSFLNYSLISYVQIIVFIILGFLSFKKYKDKEDKTSLFNLLFPIVLIIVGIINFPTFIFSILAVSSGTSIFSYIGLSYLAFFIITPLSLFFGFKWLYYIRSVRKNERLNVNISGNYVKIIGPIFLILNGLLTISGVYVAWELMQAFSKAWSAG